MTSYEDIIKNIKEIISKSDKKMKAFETEESFDYEKHFVHILKCDIAVELKDELINLLITEEVLYHFSKYEEPYIENNKLIDKCQKCIDNNFSNLSKYERVIEILNNANMKSASILMEDFGYLVCRGDYEEFCELCKELKIGMGEKINDSSKAVSVAERIAKKSNQYERLRPYLQDSFTFEEVKTEDSSKKVEKYYVENLDDLINVLKEDKSLTYKSLETLIPLVGYENYKYIVDRLYELNVITHLDYIDFIESLTNSPYEKNLLRR